MHFKAILIYVTLCHFAAYNAASTVNLSDERRQCEILCSSTGGSPQFQHDTKTCTCLLPEDVDDAEAALLHKNIETVHHHQRKRETEVPTEEVKEIEAIVEEKEVVSSTEPIVEVMEPEKVEEVKEEEVVVGQKAPEPFKKLRGLLGQKLKEPKTITQEQQKMILQQLHDHVARLEKYTDARTRQFEIEAIRSNLKQLSQTSLVITAPKSRFAEEGLKKHSLLKITSPRLRLVGVKAPQMEEESDVDTAVKEIKKIHPRFEIITQDPSLIDEE